MNQDYTHTQPPKTQKVAYYIGDKPVTYYDGGQNILARNTHTNPSTTVMTNNTVGSRTRNKSREVERRRSRSSSISSQGVKGQRRSQKKVGLGQKIKNKFRSKSKKQKKSTVVE